MTEYVSDEKAYHTEEEDPIGTYESTSQGEGKNIHFISLGEKLKF